MNDERAIALFDAIPSAITTRDGGIQKANWDHLVGEAGEQIKQVFRHAAERGWFYHGSGRIYRFRENGTVYNSPCFVEPKLYGGSDYYRPENQENDEILILKKHISNYEQYIPFSRKREALITGWSWIPEENNGHEVTRAVPVHILEEVLEDTKVRLAAAEKEPFLLKKKRKRPDRYDTRLKTPWTPPEREQRIFPNQSRPKGLTAFVITGYKSNMGLFREEIDDANPFMRRYFATDFKSALSSFLIVHEKMAMTVIRTVHDDEPFVPDEILS